MKLNTIKGMLKGRNVLKYGETIRSTILMQCR